MRTVSGFRSQIRSERQPIGGLLTRLEVAKFLRVDPTTLWLWRKKGLGPRWMRLSGRLIRYRWADVKTWLAKAESKGAR